MPAPVAIPNADLPAGEPYGQEEASVDIRYPLALNHYKAFKRSFTNVGAPSLTISLGKCSEATKIPIFKEMIEARIPRPEEDIASHLSDSTIILQKDRQGRMKQVPFPKGNPSTNSTVPSPMRHIRRLLKLVPSTTPPPSSAPPLSGWLEWLPCLPGMEFPLLVSPPRVLPDSLRLHASGRLHHDQCLPDCWFSGLLLCRSLPQTLDGFRQI